MGRKRRKKGRRSETPKEAQAEAEEAPPSAPPEPALSSKQRWLYRLSLLFLFPCLIFGSYLWLEPVGLLFLLREALGGALPLFAWGLPLLGAASLVVFCWLEGLRRPSRTPFWVGPVLIAVGVALGHAAFPPLDLNILAYVCFVPWLYFLIRERTRRALVLTWVFGYLHLLFTSTWIEVVAPEGLCGAAFLQGTYACLFGIGIRRGFRRSRLPLSLLAAVFWVAEEYWRSAFLFIKYPLCQLGYTQSSQLWLIQVAELTSVYGVSFFVLAVNGFLAELCLTRAWKRGLAVLAPALRPASWALPLAAGVFLAGFGWYRLGPGEVPMVEGPRVALIQGNLSQQRKDLDKERGWTASERLKMYGDLTRTLADDDSVDLLCWPETLLPMPSSNHLPLVAFPGWGLMSRQTPLEYAVLLDCPFLYGQMHFEFKGPRLTAEPGSEDWYREVREMYFDLRELENGVDYDAHNSAFLMDTDGALLGRYDKLCPVPMSEYRPFQDTWPWMFSLLGNLVPPGFTHYREGEGAVVMPIRAKATGETWGMAPSICWDTVFPEDMAKLWRADADFMVSVSNDAWFEGTTNPQMMLEATAFRAIEGRRAIARVVNTGCTSFYDASGRRTDIDVAGERYGVEGTLVLPVMTSRVESFYTRHGNVFVHVVCVVAVGLFAWSLRRRRDNRVTQI